MEKKNLYIDFDGVILDTITPLYSDYKKQQVPDEKNTEFYENYPWHTIIDDKYIINEGIEDIQKIIDSDKFNLSILTHVNSLNEAILKIKYLRKYFKDITIIPVPKAISKTKMIHTKDSILIDDYAGNLREWKKEGGIGIRFNQDGKGKGFTVIKDLREVIDMF
jgi:hypothetical protein